MTRRGAIAAALAFSASPAFACGTCSVAMFDWMLPPGWFWFFLPLSWLPATAVVARFSRTTVRLAPSMGAAFAWSTAAFLAGVAFIGPVATIPLGVWAAAVFVVNARRSRAGLPARGVQSVGLLHLGAVLAVAAYGIYARAERSPAQYVVQWPATAPARSVFASLATRPDAARSYRYIIESSRDLELTLDAAEALSRTGDRSDLGVLNALIVRYQDDAYATKRLRDALATLQARQVEPFRRGATRHGRGTARRRRGERPHAGRARCRRARA